MLNSREIPRSTIGPSFETTSRHEKYDHLDQWSIINKSNLLPNEHSGSYIPNEIGVHGQKDGMFLVQEIRPNKVLAQPELKSRIG